jgi:hypothetical protein
MTDSGLTYNCHIIILVIKGHQQNPVSDCKQKPERTLFDVCSSCRAIVISALSWSQRTRSYAQGITLITELSFFQTTKSKNLDCYHNLKTMAPQ